MAWPSLVPPTAGTVITVAWESAMVNDPLLWLRLMTGNADPPANDYVVISQGTSSTAWGKVGANVLGPGAALGNLGYTPVNKAGDGMSGILSIVANTGAVDAGLFGRAGAAVRTTDGSRPAIAFVRDGVGAAALYADGQSGLFLMSSGGVGSILWHNNNDGNGSGLDADLWRGNTPASITVGNATNAGHATSADSATSATSATSAGNANTVAGYAVGNGTNQVPLSNGVACAGLVAASAGTASNANALGGYSYSNVPAGNVVPVADAAGKLDAWVTPTAAAPVPSGLIAFIADGNVPSGWSFYTAANGRIIVAAGNPGIANQPGGGFAVGASYGNDWAHAHTVNIQHAHSISAQHSHGAAGLGVTGATGASSDINGLAAAGGVNLNTTGHTHGVGTLDVNGATDPGTSSGTDNGGSTAQASQSVAWIPPTHALNAIRKS